MILASHLTQPCSNIDGDSWVQITWPKKVILRDRCQESIRMLHTFLFTLVISFAVRCEKSWYTVFVHLDVHRACAVLEKNHENHHLVSAGQNLWRGHLVATGSTGAGHNCPRPWRAPPTAPPGQPFDATTAHPPPHWSPWPLLFSHHGPCIWSSCPSSGHHFPFIWSQRSLYLVTTVPVFGHNGPRIWPLNIEF